MKLKHLNISSVNKSTNALKLTLISCASAVVLKWLKMLVWVVVVCILLALSKFFLVPWQTDLALCKKNADNVNTMILRVDFTRIKISIAFEKKKD